MNFFTSSGSAPNRHHGLLRDLYAAATEAVAPEPALARHLEPVDLEPGRPVWLVALGKAAVPMATAAVTALTHRSREPAGGLVVAPLGSSPHPRLRFVTGDHPEPGEGSLRAADELARLTRQISTGDEVWVLLSGGTTSLIGAPEPGLSPEELSAIYHLLLGSGLDITAMNRIRKRFSRWGGGKLARALAPARVRVYLISDVIGDDPGSIGSGPCVPDPSNAGEVRELLESTRLWRRIPEAARRMITLSQAGQLAETPKPGDPAFARVSLELIASNRLALEAAARRAAELGLSPVLHGDPIAGEASAVGTSIATSLINDCARSGTAQPASGSSMTCAIWGGETTVTLGERADGTGGRCQELALAAARVLDGASGGMALLAAGTDGRDGPTDAAGAIVDVGTWSAITAAGRDPSADLAGHNSYHALDAAGALLRTGLTGTNVMDVVIGLCGTVSGER